KARCDAQEVKSIRFVRAVVQKALSAICLPFIASTIAQTTRAPFRIDNNNDFHRYALYCPKLEYPINLRERRIGGSGVFLLHIRANGTVQSVERVDTTGHAQLDELAKNAFITWRFRPRP